MWFFIVWWSYPSPFWIPAPYPGTGHAFDRWNDEFGCRSDESGGYPGSGAGTCFHSNRSSRLPPAHQGVKIGSPVGRSSLTGRGTRVGCWPAQGWGRAPALHFPLTSTPLFCPFVGYSQHTSDETGRFKWCRPFSYQSVVPAAAGTPGYEKVELWLGTENWHGEFCRSPPRPLRGTSPRATFFRGLREAD